MPELLHASDSSDDDIPVPELPELGPIATPKADVAISGVYLPDDMLDQLESRENKGRSWAFEKLGLLTSWSPPNSLVADSRENLSAPHFEHHPQRWPHHAEGDLMRRSVDLAEVTFVYQAMPLPMHYCSHMIDGITLKGWHHREEPCEESHLLKKKTIYETTRLHMRW